ncbi:TonB-dependent receptor [Dyadobacter pollutisoli]|uniref:TonB-dependent receptor n=1 Tax=Dyadobacter pollutisoli TaxID=2910158 RepID=A0A9E8SNT5_9BACT|nr:TonB-dependent receptor [Dyadobacter pollutisoli]WAC14714.1 TonB-dependent receptor [Dyadobacter pollutisoli]
MKIIDPALYWVVKIMKWSVLQLFIAVTFAGISLAIDVNAQELLSRRISVQAVNQKIQTVLSGIEKNAGVRFSYSPNLIQASRKITLNLSNEKLSVVLEKLLAPYNLRYEIVGKQIILKRDIPDPPANESGQSNLLNHTQSNEIQVSGIVTDDTGAGLPGVSILVKGTQNGTTSDNNGSYKLSISDPNAMLVFSFVGYLSQEIMVGNRTSIDVSMKADDKTLNEVVVVGYGMVKKRDLTGSVVSIGSAELQEQPVSSFNQALQGRVSGVQVTNSSNAPGGGITIRVRGGNSISASNDPLYVIDGFPVTSPDPATGAGNSSSFPNPLASINPNDIESIEILKDASATAIYGSRGANGVVLVTTKRGHEGRVSVDFDAYYGVQEITKMLDLATAEDHTGAKNEQLRNLNFAERYGNPAGAYPKKPSEYGVGTNWQKEIYRTAPIQNYQLSFSGGTDKIRYVVSGNYFNQDGIVITSNFKRYTSRINLDAKISKRLKIGTNFTMTRSYNNSVNEVGANGVVGLAVRVSPASPVFDANGNYQLLNVGSGSGFNSVANPVAVARTTTNLLTTDRILGNMFGDITIGGGLGARISLGADVLNTRRNIFYTPQTLLGNTVNGYGSNGTSNNLNLLNENILTYSKKFNAHAFDVVAGVTFQSNREERTYAEAQDFPSYTLGANNIGLANKPLPARGALNKWGLNSYLGRVNYRLLDRYLFTLTGRIDGSSRFGLNNKYGFFPSGAFAWRVTDESFMKNIKSVSDLKLRVSYGITGNDGIGLYNSLSQYNTSRTVFGDKEVLASQASRIANPDLRWEKTAQFDIGFDLGLISNRIQLTGDYYIKTTTDLLLAVELPSTTGFTSVTRNIGSLENKGFELGINTINVDGAFKWKTNGNISVNRNKVIKLNNADQFLFGNSIVRVGESVGSFYGNVFEGIWQSTDEIKAAGNLARAGDLPGAIHYKDVNGDGVFNEASDRQILGKGMPQFIFGLTNNISYRGFDFSVFFQGVQGNTILNATRKSMEQSDPSDNLLKTVINGAWRADRPSNALPSIRQWRSTNTDSFYIEDGSFVRLKNISLGYAFQVKTNWLKRARVYVSAQNLATFTKYRGYDPEVNSDFSSNMQYGLDNYSYPAARTFTVGASLSF